MAGGNELIYESLAAIILLLLWFYITGAGLLLGSWINLLLADDYGCGKSFTLTLMPSLCLLVTPAA